MTTALETVILAYVEWHCFSTRFVITQLRVHWEFPFSLCWTELGLHLEYEDDIFQAPENDFSTNAKQLKEMDLNITRRQSMLIIPFKKKMPHEMKDTEKKSDQTESWNHPCQSQNIPLL